MKRFEKQRETKKYIEDFVAEQKIWKQNELARQKAENEKIEAYAKMIMVREDEIKVKKMEAKGAMEQIYAKVFKAYVSFCSLLKI
jgi:hypothetical protein